MGKRIVICNESKKQFTTKGYKLYPINKCVDVDLKNCCMDFH